MSFSAGPVALLRRCCGVLAILVIAGWIANPITGVHRPARAVPTFAALLHEAEARDSTSAVVIGSSVVRHHFRTDVLDAETDWVWHNLGLSASFPPESYALAEAFLNSPAAEGVELMVLDLLPFEQPHPENARHLRRTWYLNGNALGASLRALPWSTDVERAWASGQTFLSSAIARLFGWTRTEAWSPAPSASLSGRQRGWTPLDTLVPRTDALHWARQDFLAGPEERLAGLRAEARDFDFRASGAAPDPCIHWTCPPAEVGYHLERMAAIREAASEKGIRCVFLFQMLWGTNGCVYFDALHRWGPADVIELMGTAGAGPHASRAHHYDATHLTPSGATLASRALAFQLSPSP